MSNLEERLKSAIKGLNEQFESAKSLLWDKATELSKALEKESNGKLRTVIDKKAESVTSTVYCIYIIDESANMSPTMYYDIPTTGYPIRISSTYPTQNADYLRNPEEMDRHFDELVSSASSPIVVRLAYLLRQT